MHAVLWLLCLLCAVTVSEAFTIVEYRTLRTMRDASTQQRLQLYVDGLGNGMLWASSAMKVQMGRSLYCPPAQMGLTAQNYMHLLQQSIGKRLETPGGRAWLEQHADEQVLGMLLLSELQEVFPCPAGR